MDEFYNIDSGVRALNTMLITRKEEVAAKEDSQGVDWLSDSKILDDSRFEFVAVENPKSWILGKKGEDGSVEEAVFRVPGILCGKDLPPIQGHSTSKSLLRGRRYMRQHVKITGFGDPTFQAAFERIEEAYLKLNGSLKDGLLEGWGPATFNNHTAIEANTRYFTHVSAVGDRQKVPFSRFVDPDGVLASLAQNEFVHTEDNEVQYLERLHDMDPKFRAVSPTVFKDGDIVEATIAFVGIPTKNRTVKFLVTLKAIVLLDQKERDRAAILRMRSKYNQFGGEPGSTAQTIMKRKIFYDSVNDDYSGETERQLSKMRIDS
ncbi:hypothetical protein CC1G_07773 [Coprinopsis cinerea okayama7|uniref:Uncharacterized protein n=1 Tax=Coprinopsis cinerea (strain Okayama-7 / 130 / ATCC MYA-4618 / FGSC 9003) TaxID=240176 RepID=A8NNZ5_COPC7|nr:hypothetical protein CC1G_07773 [Coprinopsis cinerea okayama7\|eukprot:XP_001835230.2 hypothetical protein CC1G_07773 [Coprinopsis cinerea okayama7\